MAKQYKNVTEMMSALLASSTVKKNVEKEIKGKTLSNYLFSLRCINKLTQKDMAKKLKCSQSKISKIESSFDEDLVVDDLFGYAMACNLELSIGFRNKNVKIVDLIKFHAFRIKVYLDQLRDMAKDDEALADAILDFYEEAEFNLKKIIRKSKSVLDGNRKVKSSKMKDYIHISPPLSERKKLVEHEELVHS